MEKIPQCWSSNVKVFKEYFHCIIMIMIMIRVVFPIRKLCGLAEEFVNVKMISYLNKVFGNLLQTVKFFRFQCNVSLPPIFFI